MSGHDQPRTASAGRRPTTCDTSTQYTVDAVAKDPAGRESDKHATFTTIVPKDTFVGYFTPEDGVHGRRRHGGLPSTSTAPITDKKAVEKGLRSPRRPPCTSPALDRRHRSSYFRPQNYWAAGTKVTLDLNLDGVEGAPGVYGKQHKYGALHRRPPPGQRRGRRQAHA